MIDYSTSKYLLIDLFFNGVVSFQSFPLFRDTIIYLYILYNIVIGLYIYISHNLTVESVKLCEIKLHR